MYTFSKCQCFQMLDNNNYCSVAREKLFRQVDFVMDSTRIWNNHSVNRELHDWHGTTSIQHLNHPRHLPHCTHACCYTGSIGMIHRHLNKLVHTSWNYIAVWGMQLYTGNGWTSADFVGLGPALSSQATECSLHLQSANPISGIHSFRIPHPCHDLKVCPERMIFHSTWRRREFLGLTNAFEEITFLVSTLLRRECSDWPSLPPPLVQQWLSVPFLQCPLYSDFAYRTVLHSLQELGLPLSTSGSKASFPYRICET